MRCRGRAGDREHLVDDGVVGITATRERLQRRGVEATILDEAVVDVDADHLSEHDETVGRFSVQVLEIDDLQELAFERAGRGGDARRPDQPRGGGSEPRLLHLVHAARKLRRGFHHRGAEVIGCEIADELPGLFDEDQRVLGPFAREQHDRRSIGDSVEERVGREIDLTVRAHGGDPADWPGGDDRLEWVARKAMIVLRGVVEH